MSEDLVAGEAHGGHANSQLVQFLSLGICEVGGTLRGSTCLHARQLITIGHVAVQPADLRRTIGMQKVDLMGVCACVASNQLELCVFEKINNQEGSR